MSISESLSSTTGIELTPAVNTRNTQDIRNIDVARLACNASCEILKSTDLN